MIDDRGKWHLGMGAEVVKEGVRFRVWAPKRKRVEVVIQGGRKERSRLTPEGNGYFSGTVPDLPTGSAYRYRLDGKEEYPDPCSRYQPEGPHGPSMVVDPRAYRWNDAEWKGIDLSGQVLYELHIGAFTKEGTFDEAAHQMEELKQLGVTLIELMPVAEFSGRWGWGYDGVDLYAPFHHYGGPDALKRFVDRAHAVGLGVLLDVVYNHLGPDGNYLKAFSDDYFTDRYKNEWGEAINFDGPNSKEVREFFIQNACYWISEFHMDGLRLDATQTIHDAGPVHILAELSQRTREAAGGRPIILTAENEPQQVKLLASVEKGGYGMDALWNDDFHHSARVALTGRHEAYYTDYRGEVQELLSSVKRGFLYQGQHYLWQKKQRGSAVTTEPASAFIFYLQNHDQIANHVRGERIHLLSSPAHCRAMTALLLLAPETPLLFMGQEFAASSPFLYFADHAQELALKVSAGRKEFLAQFPSYAGPEAQEQVPDPASVSTFERSKLDFSERRLHSDTYRLYEDLLRLRREDPVIAAQARDRIDGAVIGPRGFVLRFFGAQGEDRLLILNMGEDLCYSPSPEPLLAPVPGGGWKLVWSSEDPKYGGTGRIDPYSEKGWMLPGGSALFLSSDGPFESEDPAAAPNRKTDRMKKPAVRRGRSHLKSRRSNGI